MKNHPSRINLRGADQRSIIKCFLLLLGCVALLWGCEKDESPNLPAGRTFSGITERDEWGDTLSVDTTDWVIVGPVGSAGIAPATLPCYRDGKYLGERRVESGGGQLDYSIGAYPNPFIAGAGRLLIDLVIPAEAPVEIHAEDESGQISAPVFALPTALGYYIITWSAQDSTGQRLPDGIYRIFFESGLVSSFGDVVVTLAQHPDPPTNQDYVVFAQEHYDESEYTAYEYWIATSYGPTGEWGGSNRYPLPISLWQLLTYPQKFQYLPAHMNYDLSAASLYQYHYLLAYKNYQFGAGWPDSLDIGITDSTKAWWQKENSDHNEFVEMFEGGQ